MTETPVISIFMLVYNHETYLDQAMESIFTQKVSVPFELVVGEDRSTDRSREVLDRWKARFPEQITLLYRDHNLGMNANSMDVFAHCRGKYLAFLEGDDFWVDETKLETCYRFLEEHPEYRGVTTNCRVVDRDGVPQESLQSNYPIQRERDFTWKDLRAGRNPGQTATFFLHNFFRDFSEAEREIFVACQANPDSRIVTAVTLQGPMHILEQTTSAYRFVTEGGSNWNSLAANKNLSMKYYEAAQALEQMAGALAGGKNMQLPGRRYLILISALLRMRRSGSAEDREIFHRIWKKEKHKIGFFWFCVKRKTIG